MKSREKNNTYKKQNYFFSPRLIRLGRRNILCYYYTMENNYDIIAIGETTIDAFIRLKDASVHCDVNKENCQICIAFGAKIPYESVTEVPAVGNAANAGVVAD